MIPFSLLDLAPIGESQSTSQAIVNSRILAKAAEKAGYKRYWLAEHHGMRAIASSATAVMLAQAGMATESIRIGSGGIMLPNHAPLMVAEQFGTLAEMFPNRVDLGLGRAPGTDPKTSQALRRPTMDVVEGYPADVELLMSYLSDSPGDVLAIPGSGTKVPLWLLGSSLYSAQLSAAFGLPYAYASHFAPDFLTQALSMYRNKFKPSHQMGQPYAMAGVAVVIGETNEQAQYLFSSAKQQFLNLRRGLNEAFPKPDANLEEHASETELMMVDRTLRYSLVGDKASVAHQLSQFIRLTQVDEIMITIPVYDMEKRLDVLNQFAAIAADLDLD
ncbi:LLM class flavin-dependent oxidoreductase [Celerinatantimonas sp. MCCC 1A17872]|uniref:LLM class flavin-dependent oxidoreductase n=1 Tax=Celerinatantimonas sp. MCCC 1A17872 TaxID=3177514 RepID=UPI0038C5E1A1